jgi:hypothetical protein
MILDQGGEWKEESRGNVEWRMESKGKGQSDNKEWK